MTKKFDVVIGNPPYQVEARGTTTHAMPIYHLFMDAAYEVAEKAVLITPARFLFNAGYTTVGNSSSSYGNILAWGDPRIVGVEAIVKF